MFVWFVDHEASDVEVAYASEHGGLHGEIKDVLKEVYPFNAKHGNDVWLKVEGHKYYRQDEEGVEHRVYESVTGVVGQYAEEFDAEKVVEGMLSRTLRAEYHWGSEEEMGGRDIRLKWAANGHVASARGTLFHAQVEAYLNGQYDPQRVGGRCSPEFMQFMKYVEEVKERRKWVPLRTEVSIWDPAMDVAGQIDALFQDEEGLVHMVDWKRSKAIRMEGFGGRKMRSPLEHLADCNWVKYALQQNLYKYMLEKSSSMSQDGVVKDVRVASMALCVCHPMQETYNELQVPVLADEVSKMVEDRVGRPAKVAKMQA